VEKCGRARQATDVNIRRRMRFACWIPEATDIHSEYVILITFSLQQWLRERALMFRYTYIACLVFFFFCQKPVRLLGEYPNGYCRPLELNYRRLSTIFWRNLKVTATRNLHTYATDTRTYVRPWKQGLELELSMAVRNVVRVCYAQCTAPALHEYRHSFCPTSVIVIVDVTLKPR
jgi:hypothetical protein